MIDGMTLQSWLKEKGLYRGKTDGQVGPQTREAINRLLLIDLPSSVGWGDARKRMAAEQLFLEDHGHDVGGVDGFYGPKSEAAHQAWVNAQRQIDAHLPESAPIVAQRKGIWPRQKDMMAFYGNVGHHQRLVVPPYPLFYDGKQVQRISLHEKCADSALRALNCVLNVYGLEKIHALGLDIYGGSLNVRKMRNGTAWSTHAWGAAIDFDPAHNGLYQDHTTARFARPEYAAWFACWHAEGWTCLGPARDFDWMHVQAADL